MVAGEEEKGTEVLEEAPVSEDWGGGGESCLEDLAAERRRREVQEGVLGGGGRKRRTFSTYLEKQDYLNLKKSLLQDVNDKGARGNGMPRNLARN